MAILHQNTLTKKLTSVNVSTMTRQRLEDKRRRLAQTPPPLEHILRASLFKRFRRCGRDTCYCATGQGHPGFYLGVSAPGGKTIQVSLPEQLVPVAQQWIDNYDRLWKLIEDVSAINRELLKQRWVDSQPPVRAKKGAGRKKLSKR